jgi:peptidoglycan-associated lipoprotein
MGMTNKSKLNQKTRKNMNMHRAIKIAVISAGIIGLAACSSSRHGAGSPVTDANGMGGAGGTYTQGLGGNGGFQPSTSCNVPQTSGYKTAAYYFEFDNSDVNSADTDRLHSLAQSLAAGNSSVRVVGNTDSRGSREYNVALGWRRANAVTSSLQQNGVPKSRITTDSNGAEKPIAFGSSDEDFQCNRRVDVLSR